MTDPHINFDTIKEFKKYCKTNGIIPEIQLNSKKHKNMKDEFLHEISGHFNHNSLNFTYGIHERKSFKERQFQITGLSLKNI